MYLFLDFDGVLHAEFEGSPHFCKLPKLVDALDGFSEVQIVVSSAWRLRRSIEELRLLLGPIIGKQVIGATPELSAWEHGQYLRQKEIEFWLRANANPWDAWVALDDMASKFMPFCKQLIACDPLTGMEDTQVALLRERLFRLRDTQYGSKPHDANQTTEGEK
jgi:hypothetical protein